MGTCEERCYASVPFLGSSVLDMWPSSGNTIALATGKLVFMQYKINARCLASKQQSTSANVRAIVI